MQVPTTGPLFSNDLGGLLKILAIIVGTVLVPLGALIVYFLKRGPDGDIATLRTEMNGLGGRVNNVAEANTRNAAAIDAIRQQQGEQQREIMDAIRASALAQLEATSKATIAHVEAIGAVKVQIARLEERNDLGVCLQEFGRSIERLIQMVHGDDKKGK